MRPRYRILGPTLAQHADGTPAALGGARLRALLTVLALRPGRTVPVGVLVAEVWDGEPPADAVGALQALVGRLRRTLGASAVASESGGYRLCADEDDVDLHRFGSLAREGARALEVGDAAKAASLLDDALALWRGPALADLPDRRTEAARWETRRMEARRTRLTAALALGRADEALPELAALCGEFPLDEPLQALRIRALRDAARPAAALAAYEQVRRALGDRLGTDPGPELRALHGELLRGGSGEPGGAWGSGADVRANGAPRPPEISTGPLTTGPTGTTDPTESTDTTGTTESTDTPAPPLAPRPVRPGNLRARLTSFVGREADIEAIRSDLGGARLVTLLGPGGAGKTRLSQEAAELMTGDRPGGDWPDGVWLAELAPVDDPATVPETVLTALGAREAVLRGAGAEELRAADRHAGDPLVRLTEHCARRRMLLLLDNCEHVIDAAASLADELLAYCPGLTILATSREALGVPGEVVRPVEPLPPDPAHRLFAERGRAARPSFDPADDPGAVAEICRRLDGLPLAIELAAARLRMLTPRQVADRLDDRFRLLTSGSRTVLPRQQTLRAVVDWSWDLLDAQERAVLRRLSVFAGGCDLTAAEAVCSDDTGPEPGAGTEAGPATGPGPGGHPAVAVVDARDVAGLLGSLIDKSLVVAGPTPDGTMRYRLLETVAEYTAERLDQADRPGAPGDSGRPEGARGGAGRAVTERVATERRHLVHFRELARTTDVALRGPGQGAAIRLLQQEYENLRTALRRALAAADEQEALCLILSLVWFWQMLDLRSDARQWTQAASALGPDPFAPPGEPAPPILPRCTDAPPPMSPELLQEARRQVRLIEMANMDHDDGDWLSPERLGWLRVVATVYRPGLPQTCRYPANLLFLAIMLTGDSDGLRVALDETVRACEESGYEWELAGVLHMRANVLSNRAEWTGDAREDADRSLEIYDRLGDRWGTAEALSARGEAREKRGEYALAAEDYAAAVGHAERLGALSQVALLRTRLAGTMFETGPGDEGERILREVLLGERDGGQEVMAAARLFLALRLGRTGRRDEAREQMKVLLGTFRNESLDTFEGFVRSGMAWLDCQEGRFAEALAGVRAALETALTPLSLVIAPDMGAGHLLTAAWALSGLPAAEGRRGRDAARLIGAYEALLPAGHFRNTLEREQFAAAEAATRAVLDGPAYDAARAEGAGLSLKEAAALV
ncbi:AfsR/SARP family transcriptional regulator [Streptomyces sp. NPDC096310]|uniref:AfsR/SARP family transcriptional regulator n=1 Tax=Streptomyces sp. NPDC096310 TaxID=3366082 RepID=UPI0038125293